MQTISVTRGLVELKRINDRINSAISTGKFVSTTVGRGTYRKLFKGNESLEQMISKINGSFDTVQSLISNRQKLKSAIVMSNATTKVTVSGKEYSVAEVIEMKSTVDFMNAYLNSLRSQLMTETANVEKINIMVDSAIDTSLNSIYGSEKSKIDENTYKLVANPMKEQKEAALLDPGKVNDKIDTLKEQISVLESEVDFILSESNARTTITLDF